MMCFESVIMMIWALGAMSVYNLNLVDSNLIGSANVVNIIASNYAPYNLGAVVALAVLLLPLTSGDTALRSIRMMVAEALNLSQKPLKNRAIIIIPSVLSSILVLIWAKTGAGSFNIVWRYTMFINQLIALPVLLIASIFLFNAVRATPIAPPWLEPQYTIFPLYFGWVASSLTARLMPTIAR